jgi:NADH-quinone oxidoreductase subunit G
VQSFRGVVQPLAETRPAWKVLRVLGNMLAVDGFEYDSSEQVLKEALQGAAVASRLNNRLAAPTIGKIGPLGDGLERIAEVPIYQSDAIVRRAASLQQTHDAAAPVAALNGELFSQLKLRDGDQLRISQGGGSIVLPALRDDKLPPNCVRVPLAHPATAALGGVAEPLTVERVEAQQKVAV